MNEILTSAAEIMFQGAISEGYPKEDTIEFVDICRTMHKLNVKTPIDDRICPICFALVVECEH